MAGIAEKLTRKLTSSHQAKGNLPVPPFIDPICGKPIELWMMERDNQLLRELAERLETLTGTDRRLNR